jgi:hypothetical protein
MLSREQFLHAQARSHEYLDRAGIVLTPEENKNIEVADFGLGDRKGQSISKKRASRFVILRCAQDLSLDRDPSLRSG